MICVPVGLLLIGGFVIFMMAREIRMGLLSKHWPSTYGWIDSYEVKVQNSTNEDGQQVQTYTPKVAYHYMVGQEKYNSNRRCFCDYGSSSSSRAFRVISAYQAGQEVNVYYDPLRPEISVLVPGTNRMMLVTLGIGFVFFTIGILMMLNVFPGG